MAPSRARFLLINCDQMSQTTLVNWIKHDDDNTAYDLSVRFAIVVAESDYNNNNNDLFSLFFFFIVLAIIYFRRFDFFFKLFTRIDMNEVFSESFTPVAPSEPLLNRNRIN